MNPGVSVIIPTYNRAHVLFRSISSVLSQDYRNLELIVVDDGSTDGTVAELNNINDSRLVVLQQNHLGACAARNLGVRRATGDLIAFQDSDDLWLPGKLSAQVDNMHVCESDIDFCMMRTEGLKHEIIVPNTAFNSQNELQLKLLSGNFISTQTLIGKKECFVESPFDETMKRFQDWDLVLRLIRNNKFSFTKYVYVNQYLSADSISRNPMKAKDSLKIIETRNADLYQRYPKEYGVFLYFCATTCKSVLSAPERLQLSRRAIEKNPNLLAPKKLFHLFL